MTGNDFASVVVLSYLRPDFLRRSLSSLLENDPGYPIELIVVDDGGSAEARQVILEFSDSISTAVLNFGENLGIGEGIRRGFTIASGKYIVKADADLLYLPGWLSTGISILERNCDVCMVGFFRYWYPPVVFDEMLIEERPDCFICHDFVSSAFLMRREDYDAVGGITSSREAYDEDIDLKRRLQSSDRLLALTKQDLIINTGFGIPYSTVVLEDGSVRKFSTQPKILQRRST